MVVRDILGMSRWIWNNCLMPIYNWRIEKEVYLTPVLTEESTIRSLCEPLQLLLKENNIKVNVKFNDGNHPVGHEWFAYCCSDREEADIQTLQKYGICEFTWHVLEISLNTIQKSRDKAFSVVLQKRGNRNGHEQLSICYILLGRWWLQSQVNGIQKGQ
ncbi:uncharacterized protein [Argopecten irradians]|uniref:uncharacterized protein isoform X2 n=1 Tax=Argopecten irradians TaxID=31199 RepID=UPI00371546D4